MNWKHLLKVTLMGASKWFHLLQVSSASSEPSGHSGSPSHRQRPGTHWPFKQANSAGAHVFLAAQRGRETQTESNSENMKCEDNMTG